MSLEEKLEENTLAPKYWIMINFVSISWLLFIIGSNIRVEYSNF